MIRHADDPRKKDAVMAQCFDKFVKFVEGKGLTKGKEFEYRTEEIFQCSKRILWLDQYHPDWQITACANSISLSVGFGVVKRKDGKVTKDVTHRNELKDLRYKISSCTYLELIDSHQQKFEELFDDFKKHFEKLEKQVMQLN